MFLYLLASSIITVLGQSKYIVLFVEGAYNFIVFLPVIVGQILSIAKNRTRFHNYFLFCILVTLCTSTASFLVFASDIKFYLYNAMVICVAYACVFSVSFTKNISVKYFTFIRFAFNYLILACFGIYLLSILDSSLSNKNWLILLCVTVCYTKFDLIFACSRTTKFCKKESFSFLLFLSLLVFSSIFILSSGNAFAIFISLLIFVALDKLLLLHKSKALNFLFTYTSLIFWIIIFFVIIVFPFYLVFFVSANLSDTGRVLLPELMERSAPSSGVIAGLSGRELGIVGFGNHFFHNPTAFFLGDINIPNGLVSSVDVSINTDYGDHGYIYPPALNLLSTYGFISGILFVTTFFSLFLNWLRSSENYFSFRLRASYIAYVVLVANVYSVPSPMHFPLMVVVLAPIAFARSQSSVSHIASAASLPVGKN